MTSTMRLDKDQSQITEYILNLTLEIIYLLTGEVYEEQMKASGERLTPSSQLLGSSPITVPLLHSLTPVTNNFKKILVVTQKIIDLLTGEVPIRCQDVTVYFSMEEWEYLEGHKDLYKDVMMDNQPPLTSPDKSSNGNPPERCPRPLYSRDSTQEDHTIPHHSQGKATINVKAEVKKEQQDVIGDQRSTEKVGMVMEAKKEEPSGDISTGGHEVEETLWRCSPDDIIAAFSPGADPIVSNMHSKLGHPGRSTSLSTPTQLETITPNLYPTLVDLHRSTWSSAPSSSEGPSDNPRTVPQNHERFPCSKCNKNFRRKTHLLRHLRHHTGARPFLCSVCGKCFKEKIVLLTHQKTHTDDKPYTCAECGKCFKRKDALVVHQRTHAGGALYTCAACGKCYTRKDTLQAHQRTHSSEKPYTCTVCGKGFTRKGTLTGHQRIHTGEHPFSCPECGKGFAHKFRLKQHLQFHIDENSLSCLECTQSFKTNFELRVHRRVHSGERVFSCSECSYICLTKSQLLIHRRAHTGEKPFSCSECGKCFAYKGNLSTHFKCHTGEKSFTCPQCGKGFTQKGQLLIHQKSHMAESPVACLECGKAFKSRCYQRLHTGETIFSCSECGKSFLKKSQLTGHQRSHTGEKPFSCSQCGRSFSHKRHLDAHMKSFSCLKSGKCLTQAANLMQHQQRHAH